MRPIREQLRRRRSLSGGSCVLSTTVTSTGGSPGKTGVAGPIAWLRSTMRFMSSGIVLDIHRFPAQIMLESVLSVVSPDAALLPARVVAVNRLSRPAVDVKFAALQIPHGAEHSVDIAGKEVRGQSVLRVVSQGQRFVES